jgi:hypothetical protein
MLFFLLIVFFIILYIFIYKQLKSNKQKLNNKLELINNLDYIKNKKKNTKQKQLNNPEEIKILKELINEFNHNDNKWINLIKVGNIYAKGVYPIFLPNKYKGLECFRLAMLCPDKQIAKLGHIKYIENKYNNINDIDKLGKKIPTIYADIICDLAHNKILTINKNNINDDLVEIIINNNNNQNNNQNQNNIINNNQTENIINNNNENNNIENINDLQNVHDHSVNRIIGSNIKKLQELYNITDISDDEIYNKIYNNILEDNLLNVEQRANSIDVLNSFTNINHSYFNITEFESLKYIYKYIESKSNKNDLNHILNIELCNSIENGYIVCSTGKIGRVISIIDGIDNTFNLIKPYHIIREEILNLSKSIRDNILNNATEEEKNNYNNDIDNTNILYNKMVTDLETHIDKIYIKELNINEEILKNIIEECKYGF